MNELGRERAILPPAKPVRDTVLFGHANPEDKALTLWLECKSVPFCQVMYLMQIPLI
jgi:hypothetical protein